MDEPLQILLAFVVAVVVTALELVTGKYPRTFLFLTKCRSFYFYLFIYGVIAALVTFFIDQLIASNAITLEGPMIGNGWAQAVTIGISVKAFLHIRLFAFNSGTQSIPIGVETIVLLFEPWLLREIELFHFTSVLEFIGPKAKKHQNLAKVKGAVLVHVPKSFSKAEKTSFKDDVENADSVTSVMDMFLNFVGKRIFEQVFD